MDATGFSKLYSFSLRKEAVRRNSVRGIYSHSKHIRPKGSVLTFSGDRPFHWRYWPTDFIVGAIIMATKTCR